MTQAEQAALLDRAERLLHQGKTTAARLVLAAAEPVLGSSSRNVELAATVALREGNLPRAGEILADGLQQQPAAEGLRQLRAELRLNEGDLEGALIDAADGVLAHPDSAVAKALLGTVLLEAGSPRDAEICLAEAVRSLPNHSAVIQALATAQTRIGQSGDALQTLRVGIADNPHNGALRNALVLCHIQQRAFADAVACADTARRDGFADACLFGLMGHALSNLGDQASARDAYQEALKLGPEDPYVRHLVASGGAVPGAPRAPDDYVRTVFDGYAARFEAHLIGLGYRVPGLVRQAVQARSPKYAAGKSIGPLLDLGCGTGLVGVALSDMALTSLAGVDLSPRMLDSAREKDIYHALHVAEVGEFLRADPQVYELIIAADVLCYFGDLQGVISAAHDRLLPGGLLIFTTENGEDRADAAGWVLGPQGRYAHRSDYIRACLAAAGLLVQEFRNEALRREADRPVAGFLVVAERPA